MLFDTLKVTAIAVGFSLALGLGTGGILAYKYVSARCTATIDQTALNQANAQVAALQANIKLMQEALDADALQAAGDKTKLDEMERTANDLKTNTSGGVCLPSADVERLRQWWRGAPANDPSRNRAK